MENFVKKTFLLGVGAQKAGTTWLHEELCKNDCFNPGFAKEYHTFDSIYASEFINLPSHWEKRLSGLSGATDRRSNRHRSELLKRLLFASDSEAYFDYFDYLSIREENHVLVGDITPCYTLLSKEAFKAIRSGLASRGFDIKVLLLMRDPVERIWSALRMKHRRNKDKFSNVTPEEFEIKLTQFYSRKSTYRRTDYERAINNLESVFRPHEIHYDFYERLFTEATFKRFENFVGFDLKLPDFNNFVNASPKQNLITPKLTRTIAKHYQSTYDFVENKFDGLASELWSQNRQLAQS